jgi:hypothetical protein
MLCILAPVRPRWTLTGGGALAAVHLQHRETKDLDLFFRGQDILGDVVPEVRHALLAEGLVVEDVKVAPAFYRARVRDDAGRATLLDLVAERAPSIEPPQEVPPGILVDTAHEILVNKLAAMYSRWAVRDLVDVKALVEAGGDLDRALREAPKKDGSFSPAALAWVLQTTGFHHAASTSEHDADVLLAFKQYLVDRLLA